MEIVSFLEAKTSNKIEWNLTLTVTQFLKNYQKSTGVAIISVVQ